MLSQKSSEQKPFGKVPPGPKFWHHNFIFSLSAAKRRKKNNDIKKKYGREKDRGADPESVVTKCLKNNFSTKPVQMKPILKPFDNKLTRFIGEELSFSNLSPPGLFQIGF